jgi:hypothetical protein
MDSSTEAVSGAKIYKPRRKQTGKAKFLLRRNFK